MRVGWRTASIKPAGAGSADELPSGLGTVRRKASQRPSGSELGQRVGRSPYAFGDPPGGNPATIIPRVSHDPTCQCPVE